MNRPAYILFTTLLLAGASSARAQQIDPTLPPPPPPPEEPAAPATPPGPVFDPYHAAKSIEIGTFYLKKGDYDAAIDRFAEAAHYQPKLAKPWKLMGEADEKKHMDAKAVESYKKYLEVFPHAADAAKITKRISELEAKAKQEDSKASR
jgi:tetratricopeptide (TPR) repeat protein